MACRLLRSFSAFVPLLGLTLLAGSAPAADGAEGPPITGKAVRRLQHLDSLMLDILRDQDVPGASLAIAVDGRLVFARGYGWADVENRKPVRPASRFNLASCSKPITAAAVLKLVDQGKLRLDDKVFARLSNVRAPRGAKVDPRIHDITVRQLLHHAGGLVRDRGSAAQIARRLRVELPVTLSQVVAFNLEKPLLFDPGTEAKYSNLGFLTLRLVAAHASGQDYETFTAEHVLKPMGIPAAHLDRMKGYRPREVHRYANGKHLEGGHGQLRGGDGSWVLSTVDAMRFMTSLDGTRGERVLSKRAYQQMLAPLSSLGKKPNGRHNGLGWDVVERSPSGVLYSKNGGVAGIATWIEHLPSGVSWAVFFNGNLKGGDGGGDKRPRKPAGKNPWPLLRAAIEQVEKWPAHDLFDLE
ncbi:MAG TPA: serine hydrolase domain-containing protein [Gemmataceae bacterium]|jgi:N-acyl-D-amino-acid deacylase